MKMSYEWLCDFLPQNHGLSESIVAERLTAQGLEVEGVETVGRLDPLIVVAKVLDRVPHPDADRLSLCKVTTGTSTFQVVCGAPNVAAGGLYAFAQIGAVLPNGMTIKRAKIRGLESEGMLCSETELGLPLSQSGLLTLPEDDPEMVLGRAFCDIPGVVSTVFDINVTPNRGDCLSHLGLARELYATQLDWNLSRLKQGYEGPAIREDESCAALPVLLQKRDSDDHALLYFGRAVRGVRLGSTPFVAARRLLACGIRPINSIVDATNYLMLDCGHPVHAFDLSTLTASIQVRFAKDGERMETLDGETRTLRARDLVIADEARVCAIAGVMGSRDTQVTETTCDLFLECAVFDATGVRETSKHLGLSTEASYRFERGVDSSDLELALNRLTALILAWSGTPHTTVSAMVRAGCVPAPRVPIRTSLERLMTRVGFVLSEPRAVSFLERIGCHVLKEGDGISIVPPSHRPDIEGAHDLSEELARLEGYAAIPSVLPSFMPTMRSTQSETRDRVLDEVRRLFVHRGFSQTIHFSFTSEDEVRILGLDHTQACRLKNPLSETESYLRQTLVFGLLADYVRRERETKEMFHFEMGHVFHRRETGVAHEDDATREGAPLREPLYLGLIATGSVQHAWDHVGRPFDFYDLKHMVEAVHAELSHAYSVPPFSVRRIANPVWKTLLHPGRSAAWVHSGREVGWFGALHPETQKALGLKSAPLLFELNLDVFFTCASAVLTIKPLALFPGTSRDVSLIADLSLAQGEILSVFERERATVPLLKQVELVTVYQGDPLPPDKKSLTYRLHFSSLERTLTDEEVNVICFELLGTVEREKKVSIR